MSEKERATKARYMLRRKTKLQETKKNLDVKPAVIKLENNKGVK